MLDRNLTKVGHRRETHCPIAGCSEFPFNKVSRCRVCRNDGQGKQNNDNNNNNNQQPTTNNQQPQQQQQPSSIIKHRQPSSISSTIINIVNHHQYRYHYHYHYQYQYQYHHHCAQSSSHCSSHHPFNPSFPTSKHTQQKASSPARPKHSEDNTPCFTGITD